MKKYNKQLASLIIISMTGTMSVLATNNLNYTGLFIGDNHTVSSTSSSVASVGYNNSVDGHNIIVNGINNSSKGDNSISTGQDNLNNGERSIVGGYNNNINGMNSNVSGDSNNVDGN